MKTKFAFAIAILVAFVGVANACEPCGVYEQAIQPCDPVQTSIEPCAPVETVVEPCAPIQACAPVEAIQPCAPVADCFGCVAARGCDCQGRNCKFAKVAIRRNRIERQVRIESTVSERQSCLARIFARKRVSINRQVKIETE